MPDAPRVSKEVMAGMDTALDIFTQLAQEKAHLEQPGRFGPSATFADLDADELADAEASAVIDLIALADTTGLTADQRTAFRGALSCAATNLIEHAQSTITTQWQLEFADKRHVRLPSASPIRARALAALEGVSRFAADIAALIAAPHAVALLDILDALEGAFTLSGATPQDAATAVGAYFDALPPGAGPGPAFGLLIGHLHRLGLLEANERASAHDRNEVHAGIMAARTGVAQWYTHQWADHAKRLDTAALDIREP